MCKTPLAWDWPVAERGFIEQNEYNLVGYMPQQDPCYYIRSTQEVFEAYSTVIKSAKLTQTREYLEELRVLDNSIAEARARLDDNTARMKVDQEKTKMSDDKFDEAQWLKESGWEDTLEADRKAKKTLEDKKVELSEEWDSQHKQALDAINQKPDCTLGYVRIMTKQESLPVAPNFRVSTNGLEWARQVKVKGGTSAEIMLSKPPSLLEKMKTRLGLSKDFMLEIIGGPDKATNFNLQAERGECTISIKFKAYTTVPVSPDPDWYHSGYLSFLAKRNLWKNRLSADCIFGNGGIFHSIITGFIAIYQPTLTIRLPRTSAQSVKKALSGSTSVSLGSFTFDTSEQDFSETDNEDSITFASTADTPQIIGVLVDKPVSFRGSKIKSLIKNSYIFVLFSVSVLLALISIIYTFLKS